MEATFVIARDHPALAGHFPGNPIVPGVVLLDELASALERELKGMSITGSKAAKFLSPLLPGEVCTLRFTHAKTGTVKFECLVKTRQIASGTLEYSPTQPAPPT